MHVTELNPFIVITLVSIGLALMAGMPADAVMGSYEAGVGKTLGHIALVVALGTMLGKMMAESGGAEQVARTLINRFGERNAHWAMVCIAFLVGLPLFFEVGFVLLVPIAFTVARRVGVSILMVGLPMVAGLSVVHALVPPHPAAMMAVLAYNASVGQTVLYAILIGIPTAIIAGPLYAKFIVPRIHLPAENPLERQFIEREPRSRLPSFALTMGTILLPVVLMMIGGWANRDLHARQRFQPVPVVYRQLGDRAAGGDLGEFLDPGPGPGFQPRVDPQVHQRMPGADRQHHLAGGRGRRVEPDPGGRRRDQ